MHSHSLSDWSHDHVFLGADHGRNERRTWLVVGITAAMMVGEIAAGIAFGSMALLADGVHMATHAGALAIAGLAYLFARRHARDPRFTFGTGKLGELAGFASAVILAVVALLIGVESVLRLAEPVAIRFDEAIMVAVLGLLVNLASAWILHEGHAPSHGHAHPHGHRHRHDHGQRHEAHGHEGHHHDGQGHEGHGAHHHAHHGHGHADHNLRSAYLHVLTDALTSVLAIAGLVLGKVFGLAWMDPAMGIVGAIVIARWSWGLMKGAGAVLLDTVPDRGLAEEVRGLLETDGDRVADLHLWLLGPGHVGAIVSLVSDDPQSPDAYKARLSRVATLSHVTVEVHRCQHAPKR